jgi:photosystem II stability/assembly factor-like uncharacterized protein
MKKIFTLVFPVLLALTGTAQWTNQNSGVTNELKSVYFVDNNNGWTCSIGGLIRQTTNGGTNWVSNQSNTTYDLNCLYFVNATTGWACGENGTIIKTVNAGANWTTLTTGTTQELMSIYFADPMVGIAVGKNGTIIGTFNGGTSWTPGTSGTSQDLWSVWFTSTSVGYISGVNGTFLKTTNSGVNWTAQTTGTTDTLKNVHFNSSAHGYVVGNLGHVRFTDGTGSFLSVNQPHNKSVNAVFAVTDLMLYTCGDSGKIFVSLDSGATWTQQTTLTANKLNDIYFPTDTVGYCVGKNGIIRKLTISTIGIKEEQSSISVKTYPNPSYGTLNLSCNLGNSATLNVYLVDLLGRETVLVKNAKGNSGINTYQIQLGELNIPKGAYFIKAQSGKSVTYSKILYQ